MSLAQERATSTRVHYALVPCVCRPRQCVHRPAPQSYQLYESCPRLWSEILSLWAIKANVVHIGVICEFNDPNSKLVIVKKEEKTHQRRRIMSAVIAFYGNLLCSNTIKKSASKAKKTHHIIQLFTIRAELKQSLLPRMMYYEYLLTLYYHYPTLFRNILP